MQNPQNILKEISLHKLNITYKIMQHNITCHSIYTTRLQSSVSSTNNDINLLLANTFLRGESFFSLSTRLKQKCIFPSISLFNAISTLSQFSKAAHGKCS